MQHLPKIRCAAGATILCAGLQQTQAKLQHMLNHGTPEQRQQAQQALATHAARQQAAQAAAQVIMLMDTPATMAYLMLCDGH